MEYELKQYKNWFYPEEHILFPENLKTDPKGFNFFSNLLVKTSVKKTFILDFKNVKWFEANLCAILGAILLRSNKEFKANFTFENIDNEYLKSTLKNNGFLKIVDGSKSLSDIHSGIPFSMFDMKNEDEVERYIYKYILKKHYIPKMSEVAKRKIFRSIFELYQNSVMHSGADSIFVCGQFYHNRGTMALTMVEIGRTFKKNVTEHDKRFVGYSGVESIEWAVKSGNTTKSEKETGGLGLDLIRDFLKLNKGKLQICSDDGYWEEKKSIKFVQTLKNKFSGSIVNIEFNLRDNSSYISKEELKIEDIL